MNLLDLTLLATLLAMTSGDDTLPKTVAEASAFARTSTSEEVARFVDACTAASPDVVRLSLATTSQGRDVPLVLVARPPAKSLAEARSRGKLAVLVMANIHAGEVEGKEAVQILLRELAQGEHRELFGELVLAFVPNYNPDGNDAIDRKNRPDQNGPIEGVGKRANGQGLDLNRDFVKAAAPETRGLIAAVNELDAAIVMDLHATDGSFHGYELTYGGPMHPATDPALLAFTDRTLLPALRARMREGGFETFDYGDFAEQKAPEKGWFTFDFKTRYGTNYFGLANRFTILSEAYSHESFEQRIAATRAFVLETLRFASVHATEVKSLRAAANERAAALAGTDAKVPAGAAITCTRERDKVLVGACREEKDAVTGLVRVIDTGECREVEMPVHVSFTGTNPQAVPLAWAIPAATPELEKLLVLHGLRVERLASSRRASVRAFQVASRKEDARPFQGHKLVRLDGSDAPADVELETGTLIVPGNQPLARLAFALLEPTSEDGLGTWGILGTVPNRDGTEAFVGLRLLAWKE